MSSFPPLRTGCNNCPPISKAAPSSMSATASCASRINPCGSLIPIKLSAILKRFLAIPNDNAAPPIEPKGGATGAPTIPPTVNAPISAAGCINGLTFKYILCALSNSGVSFGISPRSNAVATIIEFSLKSFRNLICSVPCIFLKSFANSGFPISVPNLSSEKNLRCSSISILRTSETREKLSRSCFGSGKKSVGFSLKAGNILFAIISFPRHIY